MAEQPRHDSGPETIEHIRQVHERLKKVCTELRDRGYLHDASKLGPNEKPIFGFPDLDVDTGRSSWQVKFGFRC